MAGIQGPNQLLDFARVILKRRWQICVPALLVSALGLCIAVIVPKRYKLSTKIEINETRVEPDSRLKNPQEMAAKREALNAPEHIRHYNRVQEIVDRNPRLWPEYVVADENEKQEILRTILDNLQANPQDKKNSSGSIFVTITYSDPDRERAAKFLKDLSEDWLLDVLDQDRQQLRHERDSFKELADLAQKQYDEKSSEFTRLALQLDMDPDRILTQGASGREDTSDWHYRTRDEAKSEQVNIETELGSARRELVLMNERYEAEPDQVSEMDAVKGVDRTELIRQKGVALNDLEESRAKITPNNSGWKKLTASIDELRAEIQDLEDEERGDSLVERMVPNPQKKAILLEMREQENLVKRLDGALAFQLERVKRLEEETRARTQHKERLEKLRNELQLAQANLNDRRQLLAVKEASVRILEESPKPWAIAQPPVLGSASVTPNPWMIIAFSVVAGLALGVGLVVLQEYARSSYRSISDLASVMNVPVLGAIETIVTRRERRRRQAGRALAGLSTAVIVGGLCWITWMWHSAPERLPVEVQGAIERLRSALR